MYIREKSLNSTLCKICDSAPTNGHAQSGLCICMVNSEHANGMIVIYACLGLSYGAHLVSRFCNQLNSAKFSKSFIDRLIS